MTLAKSSDGLAISLVSGLCMTIPTNARANLGGKEIKNKRSANLISDQEKKSIIQANAFHKVDIWNSFEIPLFQVLVEILSWRKGVFPNLDLTAVVNCKTKLCQGHMQLVHPVEAKYSYVLSFHCHIGDEHSSLKYTIPVKISPGTKNY